jgi:chemotaxis protein methyltransferase CheR
METHHEVEAIEVRLFLEAIYLQYGYDMRGYAAASIQRRVMAALAGSGLVHLGELQHRVLADPVYFASVLETLVVRVTDMFRDPTFYLAFRTRVVPVLRSYPLLKIWLAGCATGEEVYALAILLHEEKLLERTQIYATDLSYEGLERAKRGVYPTARVETFTSNYQQAGGTGNLSDYYTSSYDGENIVMRESLRRNVLFFRHNLVSDHVFGEMNVIMCRNVLIYFGAELKDRVLHTLDQSLCPRGVLCLGSSEHLPRSGRRLPFEILTPEERIYRREI